MVEQKEKYKIIAMVILLAGACYLTYHFHVVLGVGTVFTHFFYIPIILASLWWKRRGLVVAIFLAALLIFSHFFIRPESATGNDLLRALMFIVVAFVVAILSEKIADVEAKLRNYAKDLELSVDVIKKTSDKLQLILDTVSEALSIFDRDLTVLDVNGTRLRIFGLKREDVIGKKCYEAFWNRDEICEGCPVPSIFETGKESRMEKTIELADGTKKYVDIIHVPIFDVRGNVVQVLCDMRDLTEHKEMEEKLLRSERLAAIGELSGNVAHELRQPLGVISNAIYYLKMTLTEADETTREYLDIVNNEVKSAGDTITGLLEIARTRQADRQEVEVSAVIDKALEKFEMPEIITLKKDISADIPAISVDHGQMGQVFYNLINNALQAMSMPEREGRGGELVIKAKSRKKKGKAMVEVSFTDTGAGISKENMKKLFEPLFTTKARGVGLGLSICKNLVENNGGEIEVQSEEGKGTTVRVSLPAAMAMENPKS